ncbi:hypothetical protein MA20_41905 [Bradyrhizobium japonicum]|uniref:Tyr recombinase domain-containing protein n=1 Tax=Bradyrhizobium japonicum TaxID=375 RepID=A0A0A3YJ72_BRAJP|nr:tyrosine-type recombinase/integrase [Bradyrhizobium japonicum]KGT73763.1 hypothetical protein MA20_41905 [Bradyrhizobium japonicum]
MLAAKHMRVLASSGYTKRLKGQSRHRANLVVLAILGHLRFEPRHVAHALSRLDHPDILRRIVGTQVDLLAEPHQPPDRLEPVLLHIRRLRREQFVFESPMYKDQPIHRKAMADALRGTKNEENKDKTKTAGPCELLGLKPFTPHDLRRSAATLAGDLGFDDAVIAKCLDHAVSGKGDVIVPTVTGKVYNHSGRMKEKRAVLDGVAAELRRIIKEPQGRVRKEPSGPNAMTMMKQAVARKRTPGISMGRSAG